MSGEMIGAPRDFGTGMAVRRLPSEPRPRVTTADPSSVFVLKSLFHPVVAVLTLLGCLAYWELPLNGPYFLAALLAFVGAAELLDAVQLQFAQGAQPALLGGFLDILVRWALVAGFIWAVLFLSGLSSITADAAFRVWLVATPLLLWLGSFGAQRVVGRLGAGQRRPRSAAVVGLTGMGVRLAHRLVSDPVAPTLVDGFFDDRTPERLPAAGDVPLRGTLAELPEFVKARRISVVYITLPMTRHPRILDLLDALRDSTVSVYFVPDLEVFNLVQARFDQVNGIPVVAVCESPFYGLRGLAKRASDLLIAGLIVAMTSPLLALIAIGVRLSSPGPVLFRQKRYGLDGQEIVILKFRSMTVTEDGETSYTQVKRDDARVTAFGTFLRRTSLDELPQLFNVLAGSMSIVGPRPHAILVNEQYRRLIPGYMIRHKVKPGITGWAQVNGFRGGDDLESMTKRVEFDIDYLRHWSLAFDLTIIFRTASLVYSDSKAY